MTILDEKIKIDIEYSLRKIIMDKNLKHHIARLRHQMRETQEELAQDWDALQNRTRQRFQQ